MRFLFWKHINKVRGAHAMNIGGFIIRLIPHYIQNNIGDNQNFHLYFVKCHVQMVEKRMWKIMDEFFFQVYSLISLPSMVWGIYYF